MLDVRGREIRISKSEDPEGIDLRGGQRLFIAVNEFTENSNNHELKVNFSDLPRVLKPKDNLFLDDGKSVL